MNNPQSPQSPSQSQSLYQSPSTDAISQQQSESQLPVPLLLQSQSKLQSSPPRLTPAELVEVRAAQRTFEGAYVRTSLSQLSFALVVLKIFTREFYRIGALFAVYGASVFAIAIVRRRRCNGNSDQKFKTSGNVCDVPKDNPTAPTIREELGH
ncbi:hypothetical protein KEM54_006220 [Ascosphaera aggregata]|nr:hypothetical protein KEM54_006220 [Ascosphaera aggregata]